MISSSREYINGIHSENSELPTERTVYTSQKKKKKRRYIGFEFEVYIYK